MVNVLGVNGKIVITILYVYYCDMNAVGRRTTSPRVQLLDAKGHSNSSKVVPKTTLTTTKKSRKDLQLDFWEPNPAFNIRRGGVSKTTATTVPSKPKLRNDGKTAKETKTVSTKGKLGLTKNTTTVQPTMPRAHTDGEKAKSPNVSADIRLSAPKRALRIGKTRYERKPSERDRSSETEPTSYSDSYDSEDENVLNSNKNKEKDRNKGKLFMDVDDKFNKGKKRNTNKKFKIYKNHMEKIPMDKNRMDKNRIDMNHMEKINFDKTHKLDNKYNMVNKHVRNKNQDSETESDELNQKNKMNKTPTKDKKNIKEKDKVRIPKLNPEPVRGHIMESQWVVHERPAKLRTHRTHTTDDDIHIRSTRMTPMYLMQQPSEEDTKPDKKGTPITGSVALSPYSLAKQMKDIMDEFSEANATIEVIGRTAEYNDLVLIKITAKKSGDSKYFRAADTKYIDEVPEKKIIFIVHGLSVMGMSKLATLNNASHLKILLSYYLKHLDKFDIFLMPMANPDGYSAAHSISLWNKNMSPQDACPGVALDRNFDVAWNVTREISSCSQLYPGPAPFSETESKAVRDVFHYHGHKILAYIHVHAGTYSESIFKGDAILYPRGYTESQSDDDKYIDLRGEIDEAMKNASFQVMSVTVDTLHEWYGKVSGTSVDYAASVFGIPYALEFVMQLYVDAGGVGSHETYEYYALTEIWSRLVETTFNNMWKSLHATNEVRR